MKDGDVSWDMEDATLACGEHRLLEGLRAALRETASTSELAGFERSRQMYRREQVAQMDLQSRRTAIASSRRRWRFSPLLPAGTALTVCLLLPTGTAVAAYTGRLPTTVQGWAHTAFGRVGVPASQHAAKPRPRRIIRTTDVDRAGPQHRDGHVLLHRRSVQACHVSLPQQMVTRHEMLPPSKLVVGEGGRSACGHVTPSPRHDGASKPTPTASPRHAIGVQATPGPYSSRPGTSPTPKATPTPAVPIRASPRRK